MPVGPAIIAERDAGFPTAVVIRAKNVGLHSRTHREHARGHDEPTHVVCNPYWKRRYWRFGRCRQV